MPQFEIVIEPEECLHKEEVSDDLKTEEGKLKAFERMVQEGKAGTLQGLLDTYQRIAFRIVYWLCILNQSVVTLSLCPYTSLWMHVNVVYIKIYTWLHYP
jgi:hypothetical protein